MARTATLDSRFSTVPELCFSQRSQVVLGVQKWQAALCQPLLGIQTIELIRANSHLIKLRRSLSDSTSEEGLQVSIL